jgi:hypothetical protein
VRRIWSGGPRYRDPDARPYPTAGTGLEKRRRVKDLNIQTAVKSLLYNWKHTQAQVVFRAGEGKYDPDPTR